jgi:hypothetical protein
MATAEDIAQVRTNTNEPTAAVWTDSEIGVLLDAGTVNSASAAIWRAKAAVYAEAFDRTEAGASIKLDSAWKKMMSMYELYQGLADDENGLDNKLPAKVHGIVRQL